MDARVQRRRGARGALSGLRAKLRAMPSSKPRCRLSDLRGLPWPLPSDYQAPKFQVRLRSAAAAARLHLDRAASSAGGDPASAVAVFDDLLARCRGNFDFLATLVRSAASSLPEGEVWFAIGSAALATERPEVATWIGHRLAATDEPDERLARKAGAPPRGARAQHLLARAATNGSRAARMIAVKAEALYVDAGFETPPDLAALLPRTSTAARGRPRLDGVPAGLSWPLVRLTMGTPHQHALVASIRGKELVLTHEQMGMVDERTGGPNARWTLLQEFARGMGYVRVPPSTRVQSKERQVQFLAEELRALFGIDEDPFEKERADGKSYWIARLAVDDGTESSGSVDTLESSHENGDDGGLF